MDLRKLKRKDILLGNSGQFQLGKEISELKKAGMPIFVHSCGDINVNLNNLVEAVIQGLNPTQRTANMDLAEIKADYGDRI